MNATERKALIRIIFGTAVTAFFAVYSVIVPEYKYISLWAVMLGAIGTWGLYLSWRRKRDLGGQDLINDDDR